MHDRAWSEAFGMGGDRAPKMRMREAGKRCCVCHVTRSEEARFI